MKKIIIYEPDASGHHVEYVAHLIKYAYENNIESRLILLLGNEYKTKLKGLVEGEIIEKYIFYDASVLHSLKGLKKFNFISDLKKKFGVTDILMMSISNFDKLVLLFERIIKRQNVGISCILINPLTGFGTGIKRVYYFLKEFCFNLFLRVNGSIMNIFVITELNEALKLNNYFCTNKFKYIPDPILEIESKDISCKENVSNKTKFLFFGVISERKGVLSFLEELVELEKSILRKIQIDLVGKITDNIEFKDRLHKICKKINNIVDGTVLVDDRFIAYEEIPGLFNASDIVLMPYESTNASSGVLGHAALYGVPVISSSNGLIKEHIEKFGLGLNINKSNESFSNIIKDIIEDRIEVKVDKKSRRNYLEKRSARLFSERIFDETLSL